MLINELKKLIEPAIDIAHDAGELILEVYQNDIDVEIKGDGSPLTLADQRSHNLICKRLAELTPEIPVLSEESDGITFADRSTWKAYWLVDPLDGTKEFVRKSGEFTVNIALMVENIPALGVVYTPAKEWTHWAVSTQGAWKQEGQDEAVKIDANNYSGGKATLVASKSHGQEKLEQFLANFEKIEGEYELANMGSALKICLVAEGAGDIYPRLGLTSEWDTAAADIVLREAGGQMLQCNGDALIYNKENILNPYFLAIGKGDYNWLPMLAGVDTTP